MKRPFHKFAVEGPLGTYVVDFEFTWHDPPLDGKRKPRRIKQTTRCLILPPVADTGPASTGEAHCSVDDVYRPMRGCEEALNRALVTLMARRPLCVEDDRVALARSFRQTVLPQLAAYYAAGRQRRSKPGLRAARREVQALREALHAVWQIAGLADLLRGDKLPTVEVVGDVPVLLERRP